MLWLQLGTGNPEEDGRLLPKEIGRSCKEGRPAEICWGQHQLERAAGKWPKDCYATCIWHNCIGYSKSSIKFNSVIYNSLSIS